MEVFSEILIIMLSRK